MKIVMSLSYYYEFTAPAATTAEALEEFLRSVEQFAQSLGFSPTAVLNVPFDTAERREFSRRLGGSFTLRDERLKGATPREGQVWKYDSISGECRLIPQHGVVLVVTDERAAESCFGFFQFPTEIFDVKGKRIAKTGFNGTWVFRDFIDSPDPRYREIVRRFEMGGVTKRVKDEFA